MHPDGETGTAGSGDEAGGGVLAVTDQVAAEESPKPPAAEAEGGAERERRWPPELEELISNTKVFQENLNRNIATAAGHLEQRLGQLSELYAQRQGFVCTSRWAPHATKV